MSHSVRMEKIQLAAMVLTLFGLLALAVPLIGSQIIPKVEVQAFQAPGRALASFAGKGMYIVYYEQFLDDDLPIQRLEEKALLDLTVDISKNGKGETKPLAMRKAWKKSLYHQGRRKGISVFDFDVTEPGEYQVKAYYRSGHGPMMRMTLGPGSADSNAIRVAIIVMIAVVGVAGVLTLFILVIKILKS